MKLWTATLYLMARWEVLNARLSERIAGDDNCEDLLPAHLIPSVALNDCQDRVLADIDQDGFIFAVEECDAQFFNMRDTMSARRHHRVQIVLTRNIVRIRKAVLPRRKGGIFACIRELVQWEFYVEAAALLRLRGLPGVPTIRCIDPRQGMIEMDYIWGRDLRQVFADGGHKIKYEDVSRQFSALLVASDNELSRQITELLVSVVDRGVMPRDVNAANFVRAWRSEKLYLVDFNLIYLRPVPGWRFHAQNVTRMLGKGNDPHP